MAKRGAGTPATTVLTRSGTPFTLHPYEHDPSTPSYGMEAAAAIGVPAQRVFKTLMVSADGRLVVAVVPVSGQLDLKALAVAVGAKRADLADPGLAERTSGYVVGGISPIGQRKQLPTVVDASALEHRTIFVSAGRRGLDIELSPQDLLRLTAAGTARVARTA